VLLGCSAALRVRIWDALLPETLTRSARIGFFLTLGLHEQAPDAKAIKNPVRFRTGFLVVDYMSEISNLDLVRDIYKIIELLSDKIWQVGIIHDPF
jgi:hypothetical protein